MMRRPAYLLLGVVLALPPPAAMAQNVATGYPGYIVIDLNKEAGKSQFKFGGDDKVLFIGPNEPRDRQVFVEGAGDVVFLGGNYAPSINVENTTATLQTKNIKRSITIDGVNIDNKACFGCDGIGLNSNGNDPVAAVVRNTTITNISGAQDGRHGDGLQPQGRVGSLLIENTNIATGYQGLFLMYQNKPYGGKTDEITLRNVAISHLPGETRCRYLLSVGGDKRQKVTLDNVRLTNQPDRSNCAGESLLNHGAEIDGGVAYGEGPPMPVSPTKPEPGQSEPLPTSASFDQRQGNVITVYEGGDISLDQAVAQATPGTDVVVMPGVYQGFTVRTSGGIASPKRSLS